MILLQISSGRGPVECCRAVFLFCQTLLGELAGSCLLEATPGPQPGTYISALLLCDSDPDLSGTVRWVCRSSYRPGHARQNWHIGCQSAPVAAVATLDEREVQFETCRAGGAGGQHVNTTDSAVRAVHRLTGLTTVSKSERSQHQNKKQALRQLQALLANRNLLAGRAADALRWQQHNNLERGNPVRIYRGESFQRALNGSSAAQEE